MGSTTAGRTETSAFDLPPHLARKGDPALVGPDEHHLADVAAALAASVAELAERLDAARRIPARSGQAALDRDQEVRRLASRLRTLQQHGLDLCLGRMDPAVGPPVYVGRLGLTDRDGRRLLVDWRSPAAEPFFGATHADPRGLVSRRRYRWTDGRVTDYWDEAFTADALGTAAVDDQSAFVASLGATRSARMRDVLSTIQADQDAIVRAGSQGALVVDGGPGTGKTVVALHRAAYLLHADPRLGRGRGGVLFVGPHEPYLDYVADILPSLGEDGVRTCTLRDLVPEGATAREEEDPEVARLKASAGMVRAVERAVRFYEQAPAEGMLVETPGADVWVSPDDWAEAFDVPPAGAPHNESREDVWEELLTVLVDKHDARGDERFGERFGDPADDGDGDGGRAGPAADDVRRALAQHRGLRRAFETAWPLLEPTDVVGDLWTVPAYLRMCAPGLSPEQVRTLQRTHPHAWTVADLPILDAARARLGDPRASARGRQHYAEAAVERDRMATVIDDLVQADDDHEGLVTMLLVDDMKDALVDDSGRPAPDRDPLAGPFAHVLVDEAQELTDAEWQMILLRCPSRSLTIVGDRAQARHGFTETWEERLARVGIDRVTRASLTISYRTPEEVMAVAAPVIRAVLPDANVPTAVRSGGADVRYGGVGELGDVVDRWLAEHEDGTVGVIRAGGDAGERSGGDEARLLGVGWAAARPRVQVLTPALAKGLEFDLVVLVEPGAFGDGIEGAVDRYVAMTRATRELVVLG